MYYILQMLHRNFVKSISAYVMYDVRYTFAIYIVHIFESIYLRVKKNWQIFKMQSVNKSFLYKTKIWIEVLFLAFYFFYPILSSGKSMNKRMWKKTMKHEYN